MNVNISNCDRREFLKTSLLGSAFLTLPSVLSLPLARASTRNNPFLTPDVEILLKAAPKEVSLLSGLPTKSLCYDAQILKGASPVISNFSGYMGPLLRLKQGQKVRIRFQNDIPEKSIIHWHGLHLQEAMDSHPSYAVETGNSFGYEFTV